MGHVTRTARVVLLCVVLGACGRACPEETRAGLRASSSFDVGLMSSAPPSAHPELGTLPSCGSLDGIGAGTTVSISTRTFGGTEGSCILGGTIASPAIPFVGGGAIGALPVSDAQFVSGGRVDFGEGCTGVWDFAITSARADGGVGAALAMRRFRPDAPDACSMLTGTATTECGNYYFASIRPTE
jgi:hypothetical protein